MEQDIERTGAVAARLAGPVRLAVGLMQGLAGWLLLRLVPQRFFPPGHAEIVWAQQHPVLFATLATWTAVVPLIVLAELPRMRRRQLVLYVAAVLAVLAALVFYDFWREPINDDGWSDVGQIRIWPSGGLMLGIALGLFIANQLLEHREARHRLFTHYAAHFEDSWMRGFQLVISLVFAGLVWGIVELGRGLFDLIHLDWFGRVIEHNWFRCPLLAVSFAASVHLTDVRPALLRGMRNVGLTLLSWLLPLVVLLGVAFLGALAFTGLPVLWNTRFGASLLLWSVAVTLFLLNAAYNDGDPGHRPLLPLRWAARVAGPMMLVMSALAAYAIGLRVGQHGWTPSRVMSAAVALVALVYGAGYTWATFARGEWLKPLERVNVMASLIILALVLALLTPLADPERLAVNNQVARLASGRTAPDQFDYQFLRFNAGRYGRDALAALMHDANGAIAARARVEMAKSAKSYGKPGRPDPSATEPALSHVTVYPQGAKLPADFVAANINVTEIYGSSCLRDGTRCDIVLWPGSPAAAPWLIVRDHGDDEDPPLRQRVKSAGKRVELHIGNSPRVLGRAANGQWILFGTLAQSRCPGVVEALRAGQAVAVKPAHDDLQVGAVRLRFIAEVAEDEICPNSKPTPAASASTDARAPSYMGPAFGKPGN